MKIDRKIVPIIQYFVLLFGMSIAALFFQKTPGNMDRFFIIFVLSLMYVAWGCWHHGHLDRLDRLVVLEYSIVAIIVIMLSALGLGIIRFF